MTSVAETFSNDRTLVESRRAVFGYGQRRVVDAGDLRIARGEILGIFGPNGAGKTTLVRGLLQLQKPLSGSVVSEPSLRRGYVAQRRSLDLHWPMSGLDVALMPTSAQTPWYRRPAAGLVINWLTQLRIDHAKGEPFGQLSGGQQQRIILAGVLAIAPELLILDEPTDGLDLCSRQIVLDILRRCAADGMGIAVISHDVQDIVELCDSVAQLHVADDADAPAWIQTVPAGLFADGIAHLRKQVTP